jgi:hypothetical protein
MQGSLLSYVFLDAAVVFGALVLTLQHVMWRRLLSKWFLKRAGLLFVAWCLVDWIASDYLRLWQFPAGATLPYRFVGLPLEEYTVFVVHTVLTFATLRVMKSDEHVRRV